MAVALDADWVARYARAPAQTVTEQAISLHRNVRDLLGESDYVTLLQGSYKNDTALADMNDVDIVVISQKIQNTSWWSRQTQWDSIFKKLEGILDDDHRYRGKWKRNDKCITLGTAVNIDLVPAIASIAAMEDPITIYSFGKNEEKRNWPRGHYDNGAEKSRLTTGAYKPTVRLFKRWAKCHFAGEKIAPSYYIECLLHSMPKELFTGSMAEDFVAIGSAILDRFGGYLGYGNRIERLAGGENILTSAEWDKSRFSRFIGAMRYSVDNGRIALTETDGACAKAAWRRAFHGFEP